MTKKLPLKEARRLPLKAEWTDLPSNCWDNRTISWTSFTGPLPFQSKLAYYSRHIKDTRSFKLRTLTSISEHVTSKIRLDFPSRPTWFHRRHVCKVAEKVSCGSRILSPQGAQGQRHGSPPPIYFNPHHNNWEMLKLALRNHDRAKIHPGVNISQHVGLLFVLVQLHGLSLQKLCIATFQPEYIHSIFAVSPAWGGQKKKDRIVSNTSQVPNI